MRLFWKKNKTNIIISLFFVGLIFSFVPRVVFAEGEGNCCIYFKEAWCTLETEEEFPCVAPGNTFNEASLGDVKCLLSEKMKQALPAGTKINEKNDCPDNGAGGVNIIKTLSFPKSTIIGAYSTKRSDCLEIGSYAKISMHRGNEKDYCAENIKKSSEAFKASANSAAESEALATAGQVAEKIEKRAQNTPAKPMEGEAVLYSVAPFCCANQEKVEVVKADNVKIQEFCKKDYKPCFDIDPIKNLQCVTESNTAGLKIGTAIADFNPKNVAEIKEAMKFFLMCPDGTQLVGETCKSAQEKMPAKIEIESEFVLLPTKDLNLLGLSGPTGIATLIGRFIKIGMGVMGSIALIMFVYGGFLWMTAMGAAEKEKKSRDIILWSSLGILIILGSYVVTDFVLKIFE